MLDHRNIVNHLESYEDSRYYYIVMECMESAVELQELIENKLEVREENKKKDPKLAF